MTEDSRLVQKIGFDMVQGPLRSKILSSEITSEKFLVSILCTGVVGPDWYVDITII